MAPNVFGSNFGDYGSAVPPGLVYYSEGWLSVHRYSEGMRPTKRNFMMGNLDCVHTMPAHFENDEKCDGSKI